MTNTAANTLLITLELKARKETRTSKVIADYPFLHWLAAFVSLRIIWNEFTDKPLPINTL